MDEARRTGRTCPRSDEVPAAPLWRAICRWRERHGLSWRQAAQALGYFDQGALWQLKRRSAVTRTTAERVLRHLAGLPRSPSPHEAQLARTWFRDREKNH